MKRQQHIVPNMLTAAEAAAVANVSLRTLLDWLDDELLPHIRLDAEGVRVAIDADQLLQFLRQEHQPDGRRLAAS